jgi:bacterioferritin-associated ferredoxin
LRRSIQLLNGLQRLRKSTANGAYPGASARMQPDSASHALDWSHGANLGRHSLELLEKTLFSFASRTRLQYPIIHLAGGFLASMIVCSCNVLSDQDVRNAVSVAEMPPRTAGQVYGCLGCSPQCGRCARTIKQIMDEALGACAKACCEGCPHSKADSVVEPEFALAAS